MTDFAARMSQVSFQQHLDELREAGDSEALYRAASALNAGGCAAGPWEEGRPQEEGRYLVEYKQGVVQKVFVADYGMNDKGGLEWKMHATEAVVLRYAHVNP